MADVDKARQMFANACNYSKIAKYVNLSGNPAFLIPSQVIAALSLELYFKTLYYLENGIDFKVNGRYSHDFSALFRALSSESKVEIETAFRHSLQTRDMKDIRQIEAFAKITISLDFTENLEIWSTVFTDVRYLYEDRAHKNMVFFLELENSVLSRIVKMKPEWN